MNMHEHSAPPGRVHTDSRLSIPILGTVVVIVGVIAEHQLMVTTDATGTGCGRTEERELLAIPVGLRLHGIRVKVPTPLGLVGGR